jgi:tetraacyldisaccharide-1-P 4'-kinase
VGLTFIFPDHYRYTQGDLEKIARQAGEKKIGTLVVTEKDAVKFAGMDLRKIDLDILVLKISLRINENEQGFFDRLIGVYTT